jgi:hypothetical protein
MKLRKFSALNTLYKNERVDSLGLMLTYYHEYKSR